MERRRRRPDRCSTVAEPRRLRVGPRRRSVAADRRRRPRPGRSALPRPTGASCSRSPTSSAHGTTAVWALSVEAGVPLVQPTSDAADIACDMTDVGGRVPRRLQLRASSPTRPRPRARPGGDRRRRRALPHRARAVVPARSSDQPAGARAASAAVSDLARARGCGSRPRWWPRRPAAAPADTSIARWNASVEACRRRIRHGSGSVLGRARERLDLSRTCGIVHVEAGNQARRASGRRSR